MLSGSVGKSAARRGFGCPDQATVEDGSLAVLDGFELLPLGIDVIGHTGLLRTRVCGKLSVKPELDLGRFNLEARRVFLFGQQKGTSRPDRNG